METKWEKPELVVLVRSRPEEAVLTICKVNSPQGPGTGSKSEYYKCSVKNSSGNCAACTGEGGGGGS